MEKGNRELEAKIKDTIRLSEKYASPRFTSFLDESEQAALKDFPIYDQNFSCFGGFEEARRKMFGVFPEWEEIDYSRFPIKIVNFIKKYPKELTHRDYLGTILSLGIERNKVGDILVNDNGAYVFLSENIADTVLFGIEKISNCGIKSKIVNIDEIEIPKQEYDDLKCIAASMRLDALVSGITKLSRNQSMLLIKSGKVMLNHKEIQDGSASVSEEDTISIRGYGRFIVSSVDGRTGSGRLHVHIKKFR